MHPAARLAFFPVLTASLAALSCSTPKHQHEVRRMYISNVHYRRTTTKPADVDANYGEEGWKAEALPNERFDCEPLRDLFKDVDLAGVRSCVDVLNHAKTPFQTIYLLKREPAPYFEPEDPEKTPDCLRQALAKLPVPREIFFQAKLEGQIGCYSARIDIHADELFGYKVGSHKFKLRLGFPGEPAPKTDYETRMMLTAWAFTAFHDPDTGTFLSKTVPDGLCQKCFGPTDPLLQPSETLPVEWP